MALIPVRVIISILGVYACALVYTQRSAMSVAIVAMTTATASKSQHSTKSNATKSYECAADAVKSFANTTILEQQQHKFKSSEYLAFSNEVEGKPEFDWDAKLQGIILGSQFYLYIIVPTIAGRITDMFGAKWVNFAGAVVPCVLSLLTPIGVRKGGVGVLIAIRTIDGAFHGCVYASLFSLYTKWFPARERANANGSLFFGGSLGSTVMYALAGWACSTDIGWPLVYYINATLYIPWMILWIYYCSNDPSQNRHVTDEELQYIKTHVKQSASSPNRATPWLHIFTSVPVLSSMFLKMCSGFGYFLLITKMPSYLSTIFGIDIFKNGVFSASTTLAQGLCALFAAPLSNWIIRRFELPVLPVRKVFQSLAMLGPALCMALIPLMGCNSTPVTILLLAGMFAYGFFTAGEWTTGSEYAPNSAGTVFGVANSLAFVMGVVAPYLVGILLDSEHADSRSQWNLIFYLTAGIYTVGLIPFLFFGTVQQQWWDKLVEHDRKEECAEEEEKEIERQQGKMA